MARNQQPTGGPGARPHGPVAALEAAVAWPATLHVTDSAALHLLWLPRQRRHLRPFLGRSASLAEAASLLGLKKPAMSYWIDRLQETGLIHRLPPPPRPGRHAARYRCPADRLVLDLRDAPLASHEALLAEGDALWRPRLHRALARGLSRQAAQLQLHISANEGQGLVTHLVQQDTAGTPADDHLCSWGRLWLTPAEQDALRRDVNAVFDRYAELSDRQHKTAVTLLHLVVAPDVAD